MTYKPFPILSLCLFTAAMLHAQATPTSQQTGDILVGACYIRANPDYSPRELNGFAVFGDVDLMRHFGAEAAFHRIATSSPAELSETTVEGGIRARLVLGRVMPYVKGMVGEGAFQYQGSAQNGSHLMFGAGGGLGFQLTERFSLRADYEFQRWASFPPRGLQPNLTSLGITYRVK